MLYRISEIRNPFFIKTQVCPLTCAYLAASKVKIIIIKTTLTPLDTRWMSREKQKTALIKVCFSWVEEVTNGFVSRGKATHLSPALTSSQPRQKEMSGLRKYFWKTGVKRKKLCVPCSNLSREGGKKDRVTEQHAVCRTYFNPERINHCKSGIFC